MIFDTESGTYGEASLGGGFRPSDGSTFGTRVPGLDESYETRTNHSQTFENRWGETSVSGGRVSSSNRFNSEVNESDERYQEYLRQKEAQRRQEEEARLEHHRKKEQLLAVQRQREEQERLEYQRRQEEERRRAQEEETRRQEEERRRVEEEEMRQRQGEEERRRMEEEEEYRLEQERRYGSSGGEHRGIQAGFITGDREETVRGGEFGFQLRNISSSQELERLFGSLSKSASVYELYNRQGKHYVQFMGRFRNSADRREYIEFQDGSMFPLQDSYGRQSYVAEGIESRDSRFLRIEGELMVDSTGKGFIVLKDGRRFPLQGSFTYTEERTYTLSPHSGYLGGGGISNKYETKSYSKSWNEESGRAGEIEKDYESSYSSTHEERRTEDRRVTSRVYARENREAVEKIPQTENPNFDEGSKQESDMLRIYEFKKFEKLHRVPRDLENEPIETEFDDKVDFESDPRMQGPVSPCDSAKCVMLRCVLGPLKKDQEVWIGARYRVDARTLKKVALQEKVRVSTKLIARVTKQPFIGTPAEQVIKSHEIKTNVEPSITPSAPDVIPLWVVVLSACAGTIILLLLIFLLHKVCLCKLNEIMYSVKD